MFAVNKNIIQKHKKSFYINLNKLLLSTKDFDLGYIYERLWLSIFYYNEYNSNYKKLLVNKYNISNLNIYPTQENFYIEKKNYI